MIVRISKLADEDLTRIEDFLVEAANRDLALRFQAALAASVDAIRLQPHSGTVVGLTVEASPPCRRVAVARPFQRYHVFYLPEPDRITVLRVLHELRDLENLL
ncbi:MAG: type II toxin-antitoxin system RelE/ParE family toxin [Planctomycetes bacterium]|nr:type II toxin-antitoxin system RelE/ParE family toxin [Planctomycetota bacterium]